MIIKKILIHTPIILYEDNIEQCRKFKTQLHSMRKSVKQVKHFYELF